MEIKSFLVLPAGANGIKGTEIFRGEKIAGYGFESIKEAKLYKERGLCLFFDVIKELFREGSLEKLLYYEFRYSDDPDVSFSYGNVTKREFEGIFKRAEESGSKALMELLKAILLMKNGRVVIYEKPAFTFSLFSTEDTRRETARVFLQALDKVWRVET